MAYKNGRINERNIGTWSLDGEPKRRRTKKKQAAITPEEMAFAAEVLNRVYQVMEFDQDLSERGQAHPDAIFTDGGRFLLQMTRSQFESLSDIIEKMDGRTIPIDIQTEEGVRDYVREDLLGRIYEIQQIIDDVSEVRPEGA